ncbi:DUF1840 domain-containing protein [Caballeronia arationis]|uniref:DUF1840 domain-containing protein n=1 Tax=Caballeronia arationis TaxID=1777142 RepID=UPI0007879835|nr:DUF1840 domain-containing protein [Caballeronia arationis]
MMITFQSSASPDVVMLKNLAQYLLSLMGKRLGARGVILHEELPDAIARLETAIQEDSVERTTLDALHHSPQVVSDADRGALSHRAWPLLDMMRAADKHDANVIWGL